MIGVAPARKISAAILSFMRDLRRAELNRVARDSRQMPAACVENGLILLITTNNSSDQKHPAGSEASVITIGRRSGNAKKINETPCRSEFEPWKARVNPPPAR